MNVNSVVTSPVARKKSLPLHVSIRSVAHVHKVDGTILLGECPL